MESEEEVINLNMLLNKPLSSDENDTRSPNSSSNLISTNINEEQVFDKTTSNKKWTKKGQRSILLSWL